MPGFTELRIVLRVLNPILWIISVSLAVCAGVAVIYSEDVYPFLISSFITFLAGLLFYLPAKRYTDETGLSRKKAYITVALAWFTISLAGTLPYLISGAIPSFINALFESVSGFSTTGASILTDVEALPKSILFWRSLTHWIGGIGIIVLVIVVLPSLHIGAYHLFTLESSLNEKIRPKIKSVGLRLLYIYLGLTLAEVILLMAGKMSLFESLCHSFGTVATGGFSPKNSSIGGYSPYIQYVVMFFMMLAGTNFVIHYYLFKGEFEKIRKNEEFRFYLTVVVLTSAFVTSVLLFKTSKPFEIAFRESFFQVISIITCTGYATADYMTWPQLGWVIIFLAMFFGGSTGSTAGGIKMARHLVVLKTINRTFKQLAEPNAIFKLTLNRNIISEETNNSIIGFVILYMMIFVIGSLLILISGVNLPESLSSAATCMAGIGPGLGAVGPAGNFAFMPDITKLILSALMLIGRLEIYTIIELFTISFWKK